MSIIEAPPQLLPSIHSLPLAAQPSLNNATAKNEVTSSTLESQFGAQRQTVELKLSFAFCGWMFKHLVTRSSLDQSDELMAQS